MCAEVFKGNIKKFQIVQRQHSIFKNKKKKYYENEIDSQIELIFWFYL